MALVLVIAMPDSALKTTHHEDSNSRPGLRVPRVAIIGAGFVGSTTAYALLMSGSAAEIVLIDRDRDRAEGHVQDLRDAELFSHSARVWAGDLDDCRSADIIIITAGVSQAGMNSRLDGMEETTMILRGLVQDVATRNSDGILLIASNPVDVLTYLVWKWSGLPANRVIGSGTSLDTSRLRRRLAERYGVACDNVHAYIIGEHGDSQVPVLSSARVAGVPLADFCEQMGMPFEENVLKNVAAETRIAGFQIIRAKGATYYGIGAALARIVRAILRDEHAVLTVSSLVPAAMKLGDVSLSLPSVITREGVAKVLNVPLSTGERGALEASAETLKQHLAVLSGSQALA